jgi:hypothetical protein
MAHSTTTRHCCSGGALGVLLLSLPLLKLLLLLPLLLAGPARVRWSA